MYHKDNFNVLLKYLLLDSQSLKLKSESPRQSVFKLNHITRIVDVEQEYEEKFSQIPSDVELQTLFQNLIREYQLQGDSEVESNQSAAQA